jgi:hypothetical protein
MSPQYKWGEMNYQILVRQTIKKAPTKLQIYTADFTQDNSSSVCFSLPPKNYLAEVILFTDALVGMNRPRLLAKILSQEFLPDSDICELTYIPIPLGVAMTLCVATLPCQVMEDTLCSKDLDQLDFDFLCKNSCHMLTK